MIKSNINKWELTIILIDFIILPSDTNLSNRFVAYIMGLEFPPQYISNMFRNLVYAKITSFSGVKNKSYNN